MSLHKFDLYTSCNCVYNLVLSNYVPVGLAARVVSNERKRVGIRYTYTCARHLQ